ncbi:hypothetical protein H4W33_002684 [Kibdelosporangium phytohabitans]|nr:hypothetical protein [Kibdelosporangium phytohabitans]
MRCTAVPMSMSARASFLNPAPTPLGSNGPELSGSVRNNQIANAAHAAVRTELGPQRPPRLTATQVTRSGSAPTSGWGEEYDDYVDEMADTRGGFAEHPGTKAVKEGTKSIKDRMAPRTGPRTPSDRGRVGVSPAER